MKNDKKEEDGGLMYQQLRKFINVIVSISSKIAFIILLTVLYIG